MIASPDARDSSVTVHQDAVVCAAVLAPGDSITHTLAPGRHAWLQVARGAVALNDQRLAQGDGAAISGERPVKIAGSEPGEPGAVLPFDLA